MNGSITNSYSAAVFISESFNTPGGLISFLKPVVTSSILFCIAAENLADSSRCSSRILFSVSSLRFEILLILNQVNTLPEITTARIKTIESLETGLILLFIYVFWHLNFYILLPLCHI